MNSKNEHFNSTAQYVLDDPATADAAKIITGRLDTYNDQRRTQLLEIKANICYLLGEQNIRLLGNSIQPLDKERVITSVENVLLPAVQKDIAVATQAVPIFDIVPAGTDADDVATATACNKIYKYLSRRIGTDFKRGDAVLW
ncbi:MAG TPA: hypothetical protein VMW36_03900, partial [Patescibacteria group bacterium]|nr:hypothetical protein [Patescibacteria group bacterium]